MSKEKQASGKLLKLGEIIKPQVDKEIVSSFVERLYGISCQEVQELNAYDDKNYKIVEDPNMKNPLITTRSVHGYVLKIINSLDSKNLSLVEAQTEILNFLTNHHIKCPIPVRNVYGHYFSVESISGRNHVVRLLEFQPGEIFMNVPHSEFLFYQMGEYIANIDRILKGFNHSGIFNHKHIWMLESVPELESFKKSVKEEGLLMVIDDTLKDFKNLIIPKLHTFERGVIHGDFNEQNILVTLNTNSKIENDWRVSGILDFGDIQISCYIFELAVTIAYGILLTGDIKTAGVILAGYSTVRAVPQEEINVLKTCVQARLCQSLIMGSYTNEQDPSNTYVLSTRNAILKLLPDLYKETNESIGLLWKSIADDYLTRSSR